MLIRLNVPFAWHKVLDLVDTDDPDSGLTGPKANALIRRRMAVPVEELITEVGGGWFEVEVSARNGTTTTEKVQGRPAAIKLLKKAAGQ